MGRPRRVFGQAVAKNKGGSTNYQRQFGNSSSSSGLRVAEQTQEELAAQRRAEYRRQRQAQGEVLDANYGYARYDRTFSIPSQRGWLFNMLPTTMLEGSGQEDDTTSMAPEKAALDLYFLTETGSTFKSTVLYNPYFYILASLPNNTTNIDTAPFFESLISTLLRLYDAFGLQSVEIEYMVDLDEPNHLSPKHAKGRPLLKLTFANTQQLYDVRKRISAVVQQNQARLAESAGRMILESTEEKAHSDPLSFLLDLREYDVPYVVRVCTDLNIRAGAWYTVTPNVLDNGVSLQDQNVELKANPSFLAFDIECTKAPLKFPSADVDSIFMISYMVNGQGYLILSKHVVSSNVQDFEYTPKPSYPGPFHIFNEETEEDLLKRFFTEFQRLRPQIVVTYNGDFFDWPFLETRAQLYNLDIYELGGMARSGEDHYRGRACVHLDAFHWVQRDSYLPQGSQGLKAVTKYKLGYDPVEVDPEDMVRFAQERPVHMATYSVSDAVATYYLYEKYVHLFIFSLCTIIPMGPEDVLRKGSGTLCETLLMVQAFEKSIICPNKQKDPLATFHQGHLLESETYIGGKVECLETGVYRSDVEYDFDLKPSAFQMLIDNVDRDLTFAIQVEGGMDRSKATNYNEIRGKIIKELEMLRDRPKRVEKPYIYHLDVGAMYPNIILTNRLQPSAIVDDATCAACDFNQAKNGCKRRMDWVWRGDYNPATKNEYDRTKDQLSRESIDGRAFHTLAESEQESLVASRLKTYSRNAYKKTKVTTEENRQDTVCMRENDFYVDTVRCFRDRRYEYKNMTKSWKKKIGSAENAVAKKEAEDRALVYDSLQVAHKCILNSFYGYVMRKGARWRSMEMAGIVTKTGADLITQARILVEQIGRPLELDTDGIWCILPKSFPDVYTFEMEDGGSLRLEYPCVMLNADVHEHFTNHQYQTLVDPARGIYKTHSECSIFFEVDGPYRCMVLPSSLEEGKLLKKRYAVFNFDGSLAELKGFELKRRGELELIKTFQSQVFQRFLDGSSLEECYDSVAEIANHWIDVLDTQGESLETDELVDLISENRNMSRQLDDYGDQKGTSQTTARRLGEFLGADIIKDKGLNCKFIIAEQPYGAPVTERAIPTAIWKAEPAVMKHYLRKWLKAPGLDEDQLDIRSVLDWDYYLDRLAKTIQKIITIPAALQKIENPVPRVPHPDWLNSKVRQLNDRLQQQTITSMFKPKEAPAKKPQLAIEAASTVVDMEDFGTAPSGGTKRPLVHQVMRAGRRGQEQPDTADETMDVAEDRLPLSKEGFNEWLVQKKASWRKNRRERKRHGTSDQEVGRISTSTHIAKKPRAAFSSMEGYIRDAARTLTQSEWHVVEVREMTSYDSNGQGASSSGDFVLWVMVGNDSLQKVHISVPRTVYITSRSEIKSVDSYIVAKKVDRHLPHNKTATFTYEVTMPEYIYKSKEWARSLQPTRSENTDGVREDLLETIYETGAPLMSRALTELGTVVKTNDADADSGKARKTYSLLDLQRVGRPVEGEYLHHSLSYKRVFLYSSVDSRSKTGVVAVFILSNGRTSVEAMAEDITRPSMSAPRTLRLNASCHLWIVKPGSRTGQKNVSVKQCEGLFTQLLETIQSLTANAESDGQQSEYSAVSPESSCQIASLKFADTEKMALSSANEVISSYAKANNGPTFLLINNSMPLQQLRRAVPSCNSFPVVPLPFPPGPAHNPSMRTLPALNWEPAAVQLCLESFFFMGAVSFPRRVSYARYGQVPIGNLGNDEALALYDVSFGRQLVKSRALTWASELPGFPDFGVNFLPSPSGGDFPSEEQSGILSNQNELWGDDDDELASPVIRRPGAYRCVCAEIDVHDLAIAALTDPSFSQQSAFAANQADGGLNPSSPNNVTMFDASADGMSTAKNTGPLGDEMSTALSLPLLRALIVGWLRDAFASNNEVADDMLHHVYRLISSNLPLLDDPALHRVIHSMMKETFLRLLGELQRLGCTIVCASFYKVTISTNKTTLSEAEEYVNFVIATIRNRSISSESGISGGLGRIALQPSTFYSQFLFLDEYNFGGIQLERRDVMEEEDTMVEDLVVHEENSEGAMSCIIPSVVSGWYMKNYLESEIAQEYFRAIVGRYSKDVMRKQLKLRDEGASIYDDSAQEKLLAFKKRLVSKQFATYMTRAVGEISKDAQAQGSNSKSEPLEFVKSVITVLDLDPDVQKEVHLLKRSLLAQIGVPEYASSVKWKNPCVKFILPAVFCAECHESRDVNLCNLPDEHDEVNQNHWACPDCGTVYPSDDIERRLIEICNRKMVRYQLQDLRCSKTNRVSTRAMAKQSDCSANLKLDVARNHALSQLQIIHDIAVDHELEWLQETISGSLFGMREFD